MNVRQPARCNDRAAIRKAREAHERALDLGSVVHVDMTYLNHEQRRHGLDDAELADPRGNAGIPEHRHSRDAWRDLFCSSSHFPLILYSNAMKPVALPPGLAKLFTKPAPTGSATAANT